MTFLTLPAFMQGILKQLSQLKVKTEGGEENLLMLEAVGKRCDCGILKRPVSDKAMSVLLVSKRNENARSARGEGTEPVQ